jgi:hypothetical protein
MCHTGLEVHEAGQRGALGCLVILLCFPLIFKLRLAPGVVVHPFVPILLLAWGWTVWMIWFTVRRHGTIAMYWRHLVTPALLLAVLVAVQAVSLVGHSWARGRWQAAGWLLLIKQVLYLAHLPFSALLAWRTGPAAIKVVSYAIPIVALMTLLYTVGRFVQARHGTYFNALYDTGPVFLAMGTFGEILTPDGLLIRTDTVSQGAYGLYLVWIVCFSLMLWTFKGWGLLPRRYPVAQALVVCPLGMVTILFSGSRTSLLVMLGVFLMTLGWFLRRRFAAISARRKMGLVVWILLLSLTAVMVWYVVPTPASSFDRLVETARSRFDFERSATGELSPFMEDDRRRGAVVRNLETRVWLWGQTLRYLREHPHVLFTGVGMDRQRFLEEVIGLPYEGKLIHFHTAHNLFLDMLTKAGIGALVPLVWFCGWVFWITGKSVQQYASSANATAVVGLGCMLVILWPPLLLANLTGEELFTDNVQLHWSTFLGLFLGYVASVQAPCRIRQ